MKTFINNYLKYVSGSHLETGDFPGPVVTISRMAGCSAQRIAIKLSKILTGYSYMSDTKTEAEWRWVSKDIVGKAIKEMDAEASKVDLKYHDEFKKHLKAVTKAFSKESVGNITDPSIIETINNVVCKLAVDGRYIIVGRASNIILKDLPNKLSIKLEASVDWRVHRIMQIQNISLAEAEEYVKNADEQRCNFIQEISGRKPTNDDFDLIFNYAKMEDDQIVDVIINILRNKKIINIGDGY